MAMPDTQVTIVGYSADANPHKRAKIDSLFGNAEVTREQSGWTLDPSVANDDTAQTAPSTCSIEQDEDQVKTLKREKVYLISSTLDKKKVTTKVAQTPCTLTTTKTGGSKFGIVLTDPETDGSALVSVQWTARTGSGKGWPGVFMSYERIPGGVVYSGSMHHKALGVFAVQHATVVQVGTDKKVGDTLYY